MNNYARTVQLIVTGLLAMVLAPSNASGGVGAYDYCTVSGPCGEGGGDCDGNSECQAGLVCVQDQGAYYPTYPSPSANYDPSIVDVCEVPDPDLCADYGPCPAGNGDCDSNSECQTGLTCVADVGARYGYPANYDVCEAPTGSSRPDPDYCVTNYCGPGDGDCDPGQCNEGVCVNDVGAQYGLPAHYDVCEAPTGSSRPDPDYCVTNYCGPGDGDCDPGQCDEGVCVNDVGAQYGLPAHYDVCEASSGGGSGGSGEGDGGGVCDRTPQVRDAIMGALGDMACEDITAEHLAALGGILDLTRRFHSDVTTLKPGDFAGLTNLTNLWLFHNQLTTLPPNLFTGLTALQTLDLSHNQLTTLPPNLFAGLTALQRLDLGHNQLTTLPPDIFKGLTNLQSLSLNVNRLTALPPDIFKDLSSLHTLNLRGNALTALPSDVFKDLSSLHTLELGANRLTALPPDVFKGLSNLHTLILYANRLTALPSDVFKGLSSLHTLELNANQLTALLSDVFKGLANLQSLSLNANRLTALPSDIFKGLSSLHPLYLSNNQLTALPPGVFKGLTNLRDLYLNNNQLTTLPPGVFADLPNGAEMRLQGNPGYPFSTGGGSGDGDDDHGDTWQEATWMFSAWDAVGEFYKWELPGEFHTWEDVDYFRIAVSGVGRLTIRPSIHYPNPRMRIRGEEASRWLDDNDRSITINEAQGQYYIEVTPSFYTRRDSQLPAQYSLSIYFEPRGGNGGDGSGGNGGDGSGGNGGDGSGSGARGKTIAGRYPGGGATPDEDGCWQTPNNCVNVTHEWTNGGDFITRATNNCGGRVYMRFCNQAPGLGSDGSCGADGVRDGGSHSWRTNSGHKPTGSYHYQWIGSEKPSYDWVCADKVEDWTDDPDYP